MMVGNMSVEELKAVRKKAWKVIWDYRSGGSLGPDEYDDMNGQVMKVHSIDKELKHRGEPIPEY